MSHAHYTVSDVVRQLRSREDDFVAQAGADEIERLRTLVAELEDKLLATGQWHASAGASARKYKWTSLAPWGLNFKEENKAMTTRVPITIHLDMLKEIFRDYCVIASGEVGPEVDNMYVTIGSEEGGIPTNFSSLTIEFKDSDK